MNAPMLAGALDRRVRILRRSGEVNAFGELSSEWLDIGAVWAARSDVSDRERFSAGETGGGVDCRFRVRWSTLTATIGAGDRLYSEDRQFEVVGVKEIGRRVGLEISAVARTDGGVR